MIGVNILNNPDQFQMASDTLNDDIAVHTWTHPYMTTLTNEEVLGQLGWTMEIIHNSTGGRLPKYWRPPYGTHICGDDESSRFACG
jgi:chitin deacetylase